MKKAALAALIILLLVNPTFTNLPRAAAATTEDLWATAALPETISSEPMPENFTTEDYLNTTNPYSQGNPFDQVGESEGDHPLYVLVFADEEERATTRGVNSWEEWAALQLERGDDALAANFGIDIRILGFLPWESNNYTYNMDILWYELEADTKQYLRMWCNGDYWQNYVDAIIGITAQEVDGVGRSSGEEHLDRGRIFILIKWQVYWADDNVVQHEVSHLFHAPDHDPICCAMAYHTHPQYFIFEGGLYWWVFADVRCLVTAYVWCTTCDQIMQQNCGSYPLRALTISASAGTTDPTPGEHFYGNGTTVSVLAGYNFDHWLLDGAIVNGNPTTVTMTANHTLEAHFYEPVCAMKTGTNGYFYMPSVAPHLLRVQNLSVYQGLVGDQAGGTGPYGTISNYPDGTVDMNDISFIIDKFMSSENQSGWDYMADVAPDRTVDMTDISLVIDNFGNSGPYQASLAGVTVLFSTDQTIPDSNGFVAIPQGAINCTVERNGTAIGAMIIFW